MENKLVETKRSELIIGQEYYFDTMLDESGICVEKDKKHIYFEPVNNINYEIVRGRIQFYNIDSLEGFYLKSQ